VANMILAFKGVGR